MDEIHYWSLDGLVVATYAHLLRVVNGPAGGVPGRRHKPTDVADRDGALAQPIVPFAERVLRLPITIAPFDETGAVPHPDGWFGQLVSNRNDLFAVIGKDGDIDVRWYMPHDHGTDASADGPIELQGHGRMYSEATVSGDSQLWDILIELTFAFPFWRELPAVSLGAATGHVIDTGDGTAPITDVVLTFAGDGTWTDGAVTVEIAGSFGTVTVDTAKREVRQGSQLAMHLLGPATTGWPRWPARSTVNVSSTTPVGVTFHRAWH